MNRPEKRNALNHDLRAQILHALRAADQDPEVHVMSCAAPARPSPPATTSAAATRARLPVLHAGGEGQYPRHVTETWMSIWELSSP